MNFKIYIENKINEKDTKDTLKKIPKSHADLVKDFKIIFQPNNTLKNDKEHVGLIDTDKKTITIAAPWDYTREYTYLHEIAHLVWAVYTNDKLKKEWEAIVKSTKNKQKQSPEELFCMAYANHYANNKIEIHTHAKWEKFIKNFPN